MLDELVIVLGMHRSGTSRVAGLVHALGFALPDAVLPAHREDNPGGYFEPEPVMALHTAFLRAIGSYWQDPGGLPAGAFEGEAAEQARGAIGDWLGRQAQRQKTLLLKDPRLCRLLPLWRDALEATARRVRVVRVVRSPDDVYRSLWRRTRHPVMGGAGIEDALHSDLLWWRHNHEAMLNAAGLPTLALDYALVQQDPAGQWLALQQFLAPLPRPVGPADAPPEPRPARHAADDVPSARRDIGWQAFLQAEYTRFAAPPNTMPDARLASPDAAALEVRVPPGPWPPPVADQSRCIRAACEGLRKTLFGAHPQPIPWPATGGEAHTLGYLFVSPNPSSRSHIYRVRNPVDALNRLGLRAAWLPPTEALQALDGGHRPSTLILHRLPWSDTAEQLCALARSAGAQIGFDIDDLVFDGEVLAAGDISFVNALEPSQLPFWQTLVAALEETARRVDFMLVPTETLARHARRVCQRVILVPNGFSPENLALAGGCWRLPDTDDSRLAEDTPVRIGYASGTATHDADFAPLVPVLRDVLSRHPQARLCVVGTLDLALDALPKGQLERRPLVPHINLGAELARFDINLIPLERSRFCDGKSPLKYFEAALLGVPSIAVDNPTYRALIQPGRNGLLAASPEDWRQKLELLLQAPTWRGALGQAAAEHCRQRFHCDRLTAELHAALSADAGATPSPRIARRAAVSQVPPTPSRTRTTSGPDFLGIGAQKAGTTWLYQHLSRHPQIAFPAGKEVHYWDLLESGRRSEPSTWYLEQFTHPARPDVRMGDITPAYAVLQPETVARVAALLPALKLIFILRNPMERAWSAALMALDKASMTLEEASDAWFLEVLHSHGSRLRSDYLRTLSLWTQHFNTSTMLLLTFDELRHDPKRLLRRVAEHLAIDAEHFECLPTERLRQPVFGGNFGTSASVRPSLRSALCKLYGAGLDQLETDWKVDVKPWRAFCHEGDVK
ncbi:glycosyltransferase [Thiohalocapsa marina]|uniref:Glycosyltransferase n=1 Tax=Thiohalocapsa marina TaxID=424902 RepID=A0A5M8FVW7_9GAMM|nr:sulfotransferase [Thiohalocapsa marina]KAA6187849.1 glycosyltransferase [Thiohalocapsa marina]